MKNGPYELVITPKNYPGQRYRGKYCYEHHLVWWKAHGVLPVRYVSVVHHKDKNKRNNDLGNLELITLSKHAHTHVAIAKVLAPPDTRPTATALRETAKKAALENLIRENPSVVVCPTCGNQKRVESDYCSAECASRARSKVRWGSISKSGLENLVWASPVTSVAKTLGVSDTLVHKRCRRLGVQTPPRGYWAKKHAASNGGIV